MYVELLLRLFHILPAILLAGGVFFMWMALVPALAGTSHETRASVLAAVRGRWSKVVMICTALLLATGLINAVTNIQAYKFSGFPGDLYHLMVALKLLLALGVFFITAVLGGRSGMADKFREKLGFWLTVNTALLLALILVASSMKVSQREPKTSPAAPEETVMQAVDRP